MIKRRCRLGLGTQSTTLFMALLEMFTIVFAMLTKMWWLLSVFWLYPKVTFPHLIIKSTSLISSSDSRSTICWRWPFSKISSSTLSFISHHYPWAPQARNDQARGHSLPGWSLSPCNLCNWTLHSRLPRAGPPCMCCPRLVLSKTGVHGMSESYFTTDVHN